MQMLMLRRNRVTRSQHGSSTEKKKIPFLSLDALYSTDQADSCRNSSPVRIEQVKYHILRSIHEANWTDFCSGTAQAAACFSFKLCVIKL